MKYYKVCLNNNNKYNNPTKIGQVKLIFDIPELNDKYYEGIEILAFETGEFLEDRLYDVITGKELFKDKNTKGLSYSSKRPVNNKEVKELVSLYNSLTKEELLRYKKGIEEVEQDSINLYNQNALI